MNVRQTVLVHARAITILHAFFRMIGRLARFDRRDAFPKVVLLLVFLMAIAGLAVWGVHHTRPGPLGNYEFVVKDGKEILVSAFADSTSYGWGVIRMDGELTNFARSRFSIRRLIERSTKFSADANSWRQRSLDGGNDDGSIWTVIRDRGWEATLLRLELTSNERVRSTSFAFAAPTTKFEPRASVCGEKLVLSNGEQMELRDIGSSRVLDSIPSVLNANSHLAHLWGTQNLYAWNNKSKKVHLFSLDAEKLRLVHEWDVLHAIPFKCKGEAFIISLLPDGKTIEVRSGKDGLVVNSYPVPSDPMIPLPITDLAWSREGSFLWWPTIGKHMDALTGKVIPFPNSFFPVFRDFDGNRIVGLNEPRGRLTTKECVVVNESAGSETLRFPIDRLVCSAYILKDSGLLALATYDHRVFLYELNGGSLVRIVDPFILGFPINCLTLIAFIIWCILWLRIVSPIHPHGWIDGTLCVLLFIAYASYRFQSTGEQALASGFVFAALGVVMSSILMSGIWLCFGRNRLFLRATPVVQVYGLVIGVIVFWFSEPQIQSDLIPAATILSLTLMLPFAILRFSGITLQNTNRSTAMDEGSNENESSIRLRDIFFLTTVAAINASILKSIPLTHWYGIWIGRRPIGFFLLLVTINAICLSMVGLLAFWTCLSKRSFAARWIPWFVFGAMMIVLCNTQYAIAGYVGIGASAALLDCLHAYRLRGWRFVGRPQPQVGVKAI